MDKTKAPPIPEKTSVKEGDRKTSEKRSEPEPSYVRGVIDPPTKKALR